MATLSYILAVIVVCLYSAQGAYVVSKDHIGLGCSSAAKKVSIFATDKCVANPAGTSSTKYTCTNNVPKITTCSGATCASSCTTSTPISCSTSGSNSISTICSATIPQYSTYVRVGSFSKQTTCQAGSVADLNSYAIYNASFCLSSESTKFTCAGSILQQFDCSSSTACTSCPSEKLPGSWFYTPINCVGSGPYVKYDCA